MPKQTKTITAYGIADKNGDIYYSDLFWEKKDATGFVGKNEKVIKLTISYEVDIPEIKTISKVEAERKLKEFGLEVKIK